MTKQVLNKTKQSIKPEFSRGLDTQYRDAFLLSFFLPGADSQTAAKYGVIITAPKAFQVISVIEVHSVAGTAGGSVTLDIEKLTGTTAPGSGTSILVTPFNLKSTANTPVTKEGSQLATDRTFNPGNRLGVKTAGTLTTLEGVCVTILCRWWGRGQYR